jgi:hypothetical protein
METISNEERFQKALSGWIAAVIKDRELNIMVQ